MLIGLIRSVPGKKLSEEGYFELEIHTNLEDALKSGAPRDFIQRSVSAHLAAAVEDTKLPLNEGLWKVGFTKFAQDRWGFPEILVI